MNYDYYNREERALCAHLFRLLHEWIGPTGDSDRMRTFLRASGADCGETELKGIRIFTEVALIRDAYYIRKPDIGEFMDELVREVARQENLDQYRHFTEMPLVLRDPTQTHPGQIRRKAKNLNIHLSDDEKVLFGAIQGMFNAKPDLAIGTSNTMVVYEAKYTQSFGDEQLRRTERIAEVWANLLYADLGFERPPRMITSTIGPAAFGPDVSWEWIADLAEHTFPESDRTRIAFINARRYITDMLGE